MPTRAKVSETFWADLSSALLKNSFSAILEVHLGIVYFQNSSTAN